jgi:hypothetical protein
MESFNVADGKFDHQENGDETIKNWSGHCFSDVCFLLLNNVAQLDWFIKGRVVCGLPVIQAPKRPLKII